jgi:A nuclease family of the HNH/ENDO VII superfamily with conserved AHH
VVKQAVLGGIGAQLGGGKFANGAITGAFGYLFNETFHEEEKPGLSTAGKVGMGVGALAGGVVAAGCDFATFGGCVVANPGLVLGWAALGAAGGALAGELFSKASEQLAKNIAALTQTVKGNDDATHHIVAYKDPRAEGSRAILASVGMDINSGFNGINMNAYYHNRIHSNLYHATVYFSLLNSTSYTEVAAKLTLIKAQIKMGVFPF